jgi:hypothetical protein
MASQALEQMLDNTFVPNIAQDRIYQTIDTYTLGTTQLYSFDPPKPLGGNIGQLPGLPSSPINPVVVPYGNQTGLGGDVHDTFKIDRYDNPYGGHTSIKIPGYEPLRMPWEK